MASVSVPNVELFEELGRGAFSIVYRARRGTESCAVKIPRDGRSHQMRRFRNEAIALARAQHPVLPTVWEIGAAGGTPYLVMELCEGETLAQRLLRGALSLTEIVDLGRQLASALAEIHRIGLVHCDVKPQNIVVGGDGRVRLIDFGLAASADTGSLVRAGTFPYAAPEQMSEGYQQIDGRADLYGLGSVLHECVHGEPPERSTAVGSPGASGWHSGVRLRRPERKMIENTDDSPGTDALLAIVERLLQHDPDDRYPSATALEYDLGRIDEIARALKHGGEPALNLRELDRPLVVGRDRELAALDQAWQEARGGDGRVVLVRGVAGSGKTSLVRAFQCEVARLGGTVLQAAGTRYSTKPFAVVSALIEDYLESAVTDQQRAAQEERLRDACGEFGRLLKVLSPTLGRVFASAPPIPRSDDAQHVFIEGLTEAILRLSRAVAPSVLFVDDVQWLDAASASVLKGVSARVDAQATILLLAARDEPATPTPIDPVVDSSAKSDLLTIALEPMSPNATRELISKFLATSAPDDLVAWVSGINDGTPFNAVQILRAILDEGLLLPHEGSWRFESGALERAQVPQRTIELLIRRIRQLDPTCREVLANAAILGAAFPISILPHLTGVSESAIAEALEEAQAATLVQPRPHHSFGFVHESVREALLAGFVGDRMPELHRRAAEAYETLAEKGRANRSDAGFAYALASHYLAADASANVEASINASVQAAQLAFASCDNENAIRFFRMADDRSRKANRELSPSDRVLLGEALLRIGHLPDGLSEVEAALEQLSEPVERANALMRVAWAYVMQFNTDKAWPAIELGFEALGEKLPSEKAGGVAMAAFAHYRPGKIRALAKEGERRRIEALWNLCERGYQLSAEGGRPLTMLQLTFKMLDLAERLGPSAMLSRSHAYYGFVLVALGFRGPGLRWLERAQASADALGEPSTQGWVHQARALGLVWAGNTEAALLASARCLLEFGAWRGLHEYCFFAWNQHTIECLHGRYLQGWAWLKRAIQKIDQHPGHPLIPELTVLGARATLAALGREAEIPSTLEKLARASMPTSSTSDYQLALMGPRVRYYTERGDLGPEFETVVEDFKHRRYEPKKAPLIVGDYYINVAHARVHACLSASPHQRPERLRALEHALSELRLIRRIPLYDAHLFALEGYWSWFNGDSKAAERWFEKARALGEQERAPWVLYAVHRGRAHLLRAIGREESAMVHARMAELLARQTGAAYRLRWISREFGLGDSRLADPRASSGLDESVGNNAITQTRQRRQLRALLRLSQLASVDVEPDDLVRLVLEELARSVGASFGAICSRDSRGQSQTIAALDTDGSNRPGDVDAEAKRLVERALNASGAERLDDTTQLLSRIAVPLRISGDPPASIYLQAAGCGTFTEDDARMLETLSAQAGMTLSLSKSLRVQSAKTHASQSMEQQQAVDLLLGGVAQDLDRVLGEVQNSLDSTWVPFPHEQEALLRSTQRARQLAQQLLTVAQQSGEPEQLSINEVIEANKAALERIVRKPIELHVELEPQISPVRAQRILIEQLLTNLALAARQLSTSESAYVIETHATEIDSEMASKFQLTPGSYALLTISITIEADTDDATSQRGSMLSNSPGLWLAGAFAPALQNRGAHLIVASEPGIAASFSVLLPDAALDRAAKLASEPPIQPVGASRGRVVLIEPNPSLRTAIAQALERAAVATYAFGDSQQAVDFVQQDTGEIDVVIAPPATRGTPARAALATIQRMEPDARLLCVSNHASTLLRRRRIVDATSRIVVTPLAAARIVDAVLGMIPRTMNDALSA